VVLLLTGYTGVRMFYNGVLTLTGDPKSFSPAFAFLMLLGFFTGAGGDAGLTAAMNAAARSFSDASVSQLFKFNT
jgi:hypothetical protein